MYQSKKEIPTQITQTQAILLTQNRQNYMHCTYQHQQYQSVCNTSRTHKIPYSQVIWTSTRVPNTIHHQTLSPDITSVSSTLYNNTTRITKHILSSHYLSKITTLYTNTTFKHHRQKHSYTNYNKANWMKFTEETESSNSKTLHAPKINTIPIF